MTGRVTALDQGEIAAVSGAAEAGFKAGYEAAKALGASETQALAAGVVASAAEDLWDSVTGG